jgi:hypothetical protein
LIHVTVKHRNLLCFHLIYFNNGLAVYRDFGSSCFFEQMDEIDSQKNEGFQSSISHDTIILSDNSHSSHPSGNCTITANQLQQLLEQTVQQSQTALVSEISYLTSAAFSQQILGSPIASTINDITIRNVEDLTSPAIFFSPDTSILAAAFSQIKKLAMELLRISALLNDLAADLEKQIQQQSLNIHTLIILLRKEAQQLNILCDSIPGNGHRLYNFLDWLRKLSLEQILPQPTAKAIKNNSQRAKMIRSILQPLELVLQKYEQKSLLDLLKEVSEIQRPDESTMFLGLPQSLSSFHSSNQNMSEKTNSTLLHTNENTSREEHNTENTTASSSTTDTKNSTFKRNIDSHSADYSHPSSKKIKLSASEAQVNENLMQVIDEHQHKGQEGSLLEETKPLNNTLDSIGSPLPLPLGEILLNNLSSNMAPLLETKQTESTSVTSNQNIQNNGQKQVTSKASVILEADSSESEIKATSKKKKRRVRFPFNTKEEWGFDADDVKRELELELEALAAEGQTIDLKRGFKWSKLARKLGNEKFLQFDDPGPKIKAVLRRKYPELIGEKVKVPSDPKAEWGFTADDVKAKIEELSRAEGIPLGTPHKNISLSKIGAILGLKTSKNEKTKPFAERSDRGQLVHALLKTKYPELAAKFERPKKFVE